MAKVSKISRILRVDSVRLELETPEKYRRIIEVAPAGEERDIPPIRERREKLIQELVGLLEPTGLIQHRGRLTFDLICRERRTGTGIGHGIAVPHVRSKHIRDVAIGFGRTSYPVDWDAADGGDVDLFFVMAAPPYDDTLYNRLWKKLAELLRFPEVRGGLREAEEPGEVIGILSRFE